MSVTTVTTKPLVTMRADGRGAEHGAAAGGWAGLQAWRATVRDFTCWASSNNNKKVLNTENLSPTRSIRCPMTFLTSPPTITMHPNPDSSGLLSIVRHTEKFQPPVPQSLSPSHLPSATQTAAPRHPQRRLPAKHLLYPMPHCLV